MFQEHLLDASATTPMDTNSCEFIHFMIKFPEESWIRKKKFQLEFLFLSLPKN